MKMKITNQIVLGGIVIILVSLVIAKVQATPLGPTVTNIQNTTRQTAGNATLNESQNGGYIYTYNFDVLEQNKRWKAYVGNVTGTLTLDDTNGYTIYDWSLGTVTGEVYATRNVSTVNWTGITCANTSNLQEEDSAMSHSRLDNITATFTAAQNHPSFQVGDIDLAQDACYSILTYVNDSSQSSTEYFPEIALYDNDSKVVYATKIETDLPGYDGANNSVNNTYDFQILIPDSGLASWTSATAYYFYVELS